jgi:internalin A
LERCGNRAGEKWEAEIVEALKAAKVAVLLVSPQFFASDFIMKKELPYILKAAESKKMRLLWVAVTTSFVDRTKIAAYEAAHDPAKPLDTLTTPKRSQALREICEQISRALGLE